MRETEGVLGDTAKNNVLFSSSYVCLDAILPVSIPLSVFKSLSLLICRSTVRQNIRNQAEEFELFQEENLITGAREGQKEVAAMNVTTY